MTYIRNFLLLCMALTILSSCASIFKRSGIDDGFYGYYKVGAPYKIGDTWYYPKEQPDYDETGTASWYGPDFHGKSTANGDTYNQHEMTAAHRTLPMPSMVRVTNLSNNKSTIVVVNDRGPYSKGRIIDVSKQAAEELGFKNNGTAKVRVQFLPKQTKKLIASMEKSPKNQPILASLFSKENIGKKIPDDGEGLNATYSPAANDVKIATTETPKTVLPKQVNPKAAKELEEKIALEDLAPEKLKNDDITSKELPAPETLRVSHDEYVKTLPQAPKGPLHYVQAGTYSQMKNAERAKQSLRPFGDVAITPLARGNTVLYRVRVGPMPNLKLAELALDKVIKLGHADAILVSDASE